MDIFSTVGKQVKSTHNYQNEQLSISKTDKSQRVSTSKVNVNTSSKKSSKATHEDLDNTIKKLNEQMNSLNFNIKFGFNDKIDSMYVDVTEKSTGRLIRQIPSKETMKIAEKMKEIIGMIFDKKG